MKTQAIAALILGMALWSHAFPVAPFPGIDGLIEKAQHICVITIVKHISGDGQAYDEYHVWVRRTLKGSVPQDRTTAMALLHVPYASTNGTMDASFVEHRTYLVFLEDAQPPYFRAPYRNLQMVGSFWEATLPHPDWRPDPNAALRDTIKMLLNRNLEFQERVLTGDRAKFNEVFGETNAEPAGGAYVAPAAGAPSAHP